MGRTVSENEPTVQEQFDTALAALPPKQRLFVEEYLTCLNAAEAARRAGYSEKGARQQGQRLLTYVDVAAAVQAGLALRAMPPDEVLARLADQARATADDFLAIYESPLYDITGQPVLDKDGKPIVRYWPSLDLEKARQAGMLHLIKKVSYTAHGPSVELYDAQAALNTLAKYYGLLVDRQELTGKDGAPLFPDFERALQKTYADSDGPPIE